MPHASVPLPPIAPSRHNSMMEAETDRMVSLCQVDNPDGCQYDEVKLIAQIEDCCQSVLEAPLSACEADALASMLRVLADPARLQLVSVIAAEPDAEACVCNLTDPVGLSQPTVSHHLKLLHEAGVLDRE